MIFSCSFVQAFILKMLIMCNVIIFTFPDGNPLRTYVFLKQSFEPVAANNF